MSESYVNWAKVKILRLYSIVHVAMETAESQILTVNQNLSSVYFSVYNFQLVSCNFLLPWFGKWCILTNFQNCVQRPYTKLQRENSQEAKKYKLSNRGTLPIHTLPSAVFPVLMLNDQYSSTPSQQILEHSQRSCPM